MYNHVTSCNMLYCLGCLSFDRELDSLLSDIPFNIIYLFCYYYYCSSGFLMLINTTWLDHTFIEHYLLLRIWNFEVDRRRRLWSSCLNGCSEWVHKRTAGTQSDSSVPAEPRPKLMSDNHRFDSFASSLWTPGSVSGFALRPITSDMHCQYGVVIYLLNLLGKLTHCSSEHISMASHLHYIL